MSTEAILKKVSSSKDKLESARLCAARTSVLLDLAIDESVSTSEIGMDPEYSLLIQCRENLEKIEAIIGKAAFGLNKVA